MVGDRSRYGLFVSSLGAIVLAVAVFLPWYAAGAHPAGQSLPGVELGALSASQAMGGLSIVMLVLAALALLDALVPVVRAAGSVPDGAGGAVVLLGVVASICVLYRMVVPPAGVEHMVAMSLREGGWLALLGSLAMALGGIWPRAMPALALGEAGGGDVFAALGSWASGR
jgi:hypothetical protein